jgi:hypothetical protein
MPGAFHAGVHAPVWPADDSHSPWTGFRGPRHPSSHQRLLVTCIPVLAESFECFVPILLLACSRA